MTPERWQRVRSILEQVTELPREQRAEALAQACGNDAALREAVEPLLDEDNVPAEFLQPIDADLADAVLAEDTFNGNIGRRIGPYRLTELIASGGMGTVYRAVRDDGQYEKQVAVKLIHRPLTAPGAERRFAREQQALAQLEHPNIARLLDGGTTRERVAYLIMELVRGEPIDRYCERHHLSIKQRLALFREVCLAVQFAHENLVVHRDLKPGNILVTDDGVPKLVDFGTARILDEAGASDAGDPTLTEYRALTPQYSSPEQVRGEHVAATSEVYSLGVVLYELLSGRRPYQLIGLSRREIERVICEVDPPPPSAVAVGNGLSSSAATACRNDEEQRTRPDAEPWDATTRRQLFGDVDNIVLMALHKDPRRRYPSVQQLAEDVRRYLEGFPVLAHRDTLRYRTTKYIRRNLAVLVTTILIVISLVGGIVGTSVGLARAKQAGRVAVAEAERAALESRKATRIADFMLGILMSAEPLGPGGPEVTLREVLDQASRRIAHEFQADPDTQAVLRRVVGASYARLGLMTDAEPHLRAAAEYHQAAENAAASEHIASMESLARFLNVNGDLADAELWLRRAIDLRQETGRLPDAATAEARARLAEILANTDRPDEAETLYREVLATRRTLFGRNHESIADTLDKLAFLSVGAGASAEAEGLLREALAMRRELFGETHALSARSLQSLARMYHTTGDQERADSYYRDAVEIHRRVSVENQLALVEPIMEWAVVLQHQDRPGEAEPLLREALQITTDTLPKWHYVRMLSALRLGEFLFAQKRDAEAEPHLLYVYRALRKLLGDEHVSTQTSRRRLAALYGRLGKPERIATLDEPVDRD